MKKFALGVCLVVLVAGFVLITTHVCPFFAKKKNPVVDVPCHVPGHKCCPHESRPASPCPCGCTTCKDGCCKTKKVPGCKDAKCCDECGCEDNCTCNNKHKCGKECQCHDKKCCDKKPCCDGADKKCPSNPK